MTRIRLARTTGITSLMAGLAVALAGALAPGPAAQEAVVGPLPDRVEAVYRALDSRFYARPVRTVIAEIPGRTRQRQVTEATGRIRAAAR
jgi:hypothetical protein